MSEKPEKYCKDPIFLGKAIYTTIDGKGYKLSRPQKLISSEPGTVVFETRNTIYTAIFTEEELQKDFEEKFTKGVETV